MVCWLCKKDASLINSYGGVCDECKIAQTKKQNGVTEE